MKERFGAPVRSSIFRFLHLPNRGVSVPITMISTATKIKSVKEPTLAGAVGVVAAAAGVLTVSEDGRAVAAGVVAAAAGVTEGLRGWADSRVG